MTCQECEIKLGMGEDAALHLAACEECRWLAGELRLNSVALQEMRVHRRVRWEWALAVAAAVVVAIGVWKTATPRRPVIMAGHGPAPQSLPVVKAPVVHAVRKKKVRPAQTAEPLRVKMLTSDPDVVIYWIVDKKEGFE